MSTIHPSAICESVHVGEGTRIWAFAHVLPGARVGCDCNICDGVFIENDVVVGDRVTVKCGVQLWDGVRLEDDVFVGPNATFTNDRFPRSKQYPAEFVGTIVQANASIGANATILPGITIGTGAMVGAGAVVTRSVPANAIVAGNPARIVGYVGGALQQRPSSGPPASRGNAGPLGTSGAKLVGLPRFSDIRGGLTVADFAEHLPFNPVRCFLVHDVPTQETRGEHAHRVCHQFLVCVKGSVRALVDDGKERIEVTLDDPSVGLHVPPMVWGTQYRYSADAVLLVLASHRYDPDEYIRDYAEFGRLISAKA